jgi:hypothetical protein
MGTHSRLGSLNAAIIALYFAPVWGGDGLRALISPFYGFEDQVQATAANYFRDLFDLKLAGLLLTSSVLAGLKFVIAIGFLAYLIEFARALVVGREINRETRDGILAFAACALMFWAWPALMSGDTALIRLHATQFLLLLSPMIVIVFENQIEETTAAPQLASSPRVVEQAVALAA